jgi:putative ABC transport system permease protein
VTSFARLLVRFLAWLVPSDARADWRQEWLAEIEARRSYAGGPTALAFARGAPLHAWALRRAGWQPASIAADVRFALRWLARRPAFAVTSILTLAMGIGAATGILSIAYGVLWKPLPYREPDRLVQLYETNPLFGWTEATIAPGNLISWQERNQSFQAIASYVGSASRQSLLTDVTLAGDAPMRLRALRVSANFFDVLGVRPMFGRGFVAGEDLPGQHRKLVLGHGFWQRHFGGDPGAVGQSLTLNGNAFEIVGVLPEHFEFDRTDTDVFVPLAATPANQREVRRPHYLRGIARHRPGVPIEAARADLTSIAGDLEREYPDTNRQMGAGVRPLDDWFVGESRRPLLVFLAGVVLLLLMACANVAGLLVARASERRGEFGVRAALGASRARMVRQLLVEAAVISSVGAALGLALGHAAVRIFLNVAPPGLPRIDQIGLQPVVLLAAAGLAVVATVIPVSKHNT